jgi:hypothetical protein
MLLEKNKVISYCRGIIGLPAREHGEGSPRCAAQNVVIPGSDPESTPLNAEQVSSFQLTVFSFQCRYGEAGA